MDLQIDVHCIIISMLDHNAVLVYKQVSKYANTLIHQVHKQFYSTNNIYDAARNNMFISFMIATRTESLDVIYDAALLSTSTDILLLAYQLIKGELYTGDIVTRLLKQGALVPLPDGRMGCIRIIVHAIKHNKHELIEWCRQLTPPSYFAYGYARIGDYHNYIKCPFHSCVNDSYYAYIGENEDIIHDMPLNIHMYYRALCKLGRYDDVPLDKRSEIFALLSVQKIAIKRNDARIYELILPYVSTHGANAEYIVKYNALNLAHHLTRSYMISGYNYNSMTREMAEFILDKIATDWPLTIIIQTHNYKLIELLLERGLLDSSEWQLTQKDKW